MLSKPENATSPGPTRRGAIGGALLAVAGLASRVAGAAPPATVRIGLLGDLAGPYSHNVGPGFVLSGKMAAEDFASQLPGSRIEILSADDQNKPDIGVAIAREWLDNQHIDAIAVASASPVTLAIQGLSAEHKKPLLISGSGSSDFTGKYCTPMSIQFVYDTYSMPKSTVVSLLGQDRKRWFFIAVDYGFGAQLVRDSTGFVTAAGGQVLGVAKHPLGTTDFGALLLDAQSSGADVVAFANAGPDLANAIKQAHEFGLTKGGAILCALAPSIAAIDAIGLESAQGLRLSTPFYWDRDEPSRAWSRRYMTRYDGSVPTFIHAGIYSAVTHYLKGVAAAGTTDGDAVMAKMKSLPINDFEMQDVPIRADGQAMRPMYLCQVKRPQDSRYKYDYYQVERTVPPEQIWRPISEGGCPLVAGQRG